MQENGALNVNLKGFMADSDQANCIVVRRIYEQGDQQFLWKGMNILVFSLIYQPWQNHPKTRPSFFAVPTHTTLQRIQRHQEYGRGWHWVVCNLGLVVVIRSHNIGGHVQSVWVVGTLALFLCPMGWTNAHSKSPIHSSTTLAPISYTHPIVDRT